MRRIPTTPCMVALTLMAVSALRGTLPAPDPDDGGITLPEGFRALVYVDRLVANKKIDNNGEKLRGFTVAPNGDVYAKGKFGKIWAMRDNNGDGRADQIEEFGPGDGGTHIMFHNGWLYHSSRTAVYRHKYTPGELVPSGSVETIVHSLPAERDHDAKAFAFDESGGMIVEVGSPFNVLSTGDRRKGAKGKTDAEVEAFLQKHGGFWRYDANKLNQTQADGTRYSTGHRHALALQWHPVSKTYFMVQMGRDNLHVVAPEFYDELDNAERVSEVMHEIKEGSNFGWPYTYWDPIKNAHMMAPEYGGDNRKRAQEGLYDKPLVAFPAHWAPLQMALYQGTQFPAKYRGGMFVTFRGSWNRAPRSQAGYNVCFAPFDENGRPKGTYERFADDFAGVREFVATREAKYRPGGVAVAPDGSLYVGDTEKGRIWRIIYTGEKSAAPKAKARSTAAETFTPVDSDTPGGKIYSQLCATCHMPNGTGVAGMQPSLVDNKVVAGDANLLIDVLLKGPAQVLPPNREKFNNVMPPLEAVYNDEDLASVVNYVRKNFAPGAPSVTAQQVAARRNK